ncbi:MAG: response regulator transcription factor [Chloroflexi bacterium]|nr:response regulator transcription factor [Chloroflexota bacterium]
MPESQPPMILVVDDEQPILDILRLVLESNDFQVHAVLDGREALAAIPTVKPDLVLLDLMMADMDGWTVYRTMKEDETMRRIPVIVVTAIPEKTEEVMGRLAAKVDDYVVKPFHPKNLVARINAALANAANAEA